MVLLDTDHLTLLQRRGSHFNDLSKRLSRTPADQIATTIITYEEQTRGWMAFMARTRTIAQQVEAYGRLMGHIENYRAIRVVRFDERAAVEFQRLARLRLRIGTMDLKIAAIAISLDAVLLSRNVVDFRKVPRLQVENWAV